MNPDLEIRLETAEYGLGLDSLYKAMEVWASNDEEVHISNGSRNDSFRNCIIDHWYSYAYGGRGLTLAEGETPHQLAIGSAIHKSIEHQLNVIGHGHAAWTPEEVRKAEGYARQYLAEEYPGMVSLKVADELVACDNYLRPLLDAAAEKLDALVDRVFCTETPVWLSLKIGYERFVFLGIPDAVVVVDGGVYHLQHKTRGQEHGYDEYLTKLAFGAHENAYGATLRRLLARGDFGEDAKTLPYRGTLAGIYLKQAPPSESAPQAPQGLMDAWKAGHVDYSGVEWCKRLRCTDKQWEKASTFWTNWKQRVLRWEEDHRTHRERVVQFLPMDLDHEKMDFNTRRLFVSLYQQASIDCAPEPFELWPGNTQACDKYGRQCRWIHGKLCAGWEEFRDDGKWALREPDYVDVARDVYETLLQRNDDGPLSDDE